MTKLYRKYGNNDSWTVEEYSTKEEALEEAMYYLDTGWIVQVEEQ